MTKDDDRELSESGAALSSKGARKGGLARAERLGPEERSEIARQAALSRWGNTVPAAPHVGSLKIGDRELECAVVDDGTRVLSQRGVLAALARTGGARRGTGARSAPFLSAANLQPYISEELRDLAEHPIRYRPIAGGPAYGYKAEMLPLLCETYLVAREDNALTKNQLPVAKAAEILMRGLARVGIVALIDEATGYQDTRARVELQKILEAYVHAELRPWTKMFPDEFFKQIYRLQDWEYRPGTAKRTPYVGVLVNKYVYEPLPPGVLDELRRLNPRTNKGHRAYRHHQFLTADTGNAHLDRQIATVTTLMRIAKDKTDFEDMFERAFPPLQPRLPLVIDIPETAEEPTPKKTAKAVGPSNEPQLPV